jgi:hypothetical protein
VVSSEGIRLKSGDSRKKVEIPITRYNTPVIIAVQYKKMHQILSPCQHAARRRLLASLVFVVLTWLLFPTPGKAAEWSAEPSIRARGEYNDNRLLTTQPHDTVKGMEVAPKLGLSVRSDIWEINGGAELTRVRYRGDSDLDSDDQSFSLASWYKTERSQWGLSGAKSKTSILNDRQIDVNTGLTQVQRVQDARSISPSWSWDMTELTQLKLSYAVSDVSYANGESLGFYDYRSQTVTSRITRQFSQQNSGLIDVGYSFFRVPKTGVESRSTSVRAGFIRIFSEDSSGSLTAGLRQTATFVPGGLPTYAYDKNGAIFQTGVSTAQHADSTSPVYNASLERLMNNVRVSITLRRALDPGSNGNQAKTDYFGLNLERPLSARFTAYLSTYAYKVSTITSTISGTDRKLYQVEPRVRWKWTPELSVDTAYRFTHLKRASEDSAAKANAVYLTLVYQWQKISISR